MSASAAVPDATRIDLFETQVVAEENTNAVRLTFMREGGEWKNAESKCAVLSAEFMKWMYARRRQDFLLQFPGEFPSGLRSALLAAMMHPLCLSVNTENIGTGSVMRSMVCVAQDDFPNYASSSQHVSLLEKEADKGIAVAIVRTMKGEFDGVAFPIGKPASVAELVDAVRSASENQLRYNYEIRWLCAGVAVCEMCHIVPLCGGDSAGETQKGRPMTSGIQVGAADVFEDGECTIALKMTNVSGEEKALLFQDGVCLDLNAYVVCLSDSAEKEIFVRVDKDAVSQNGNLSILRQKPNEEHEMSISLCIKGYRNSEDLDLILRSPFNPQMLVNGPLRKRDGGLLVIGKELKPYPRMSEAQLKEAREKLLQSGEPSNSGT